jgi:hypothetical protein
LTHAQVIFTRQVQRTATAAEGTEFISVFRGEMLSVVQELPDGTVVVRRGDSEEEGLVHAEVFEPEDDLLRVEDSGLFS